MASASAGAVECAVWWASASSRPALVDLLDARERRRADGLRLDVDRDLFVSARALARLLLGARLGIPPRAISLEETCRRCGGDHGKPRLAAAHGPRPVAFNLAHAGTRSVVAVTHGADVGVDVERVRALDARTVATLSTQVLGPAERAHLAVLPGAERPAALSAWWARKEAVLKATGDGLAIPPALVGVSAPGSAPALTGWHAEPPAGTNTAPSVRLADLEAGPGYVGSVAVLTSDELRVSEHDGDALLAGA